MGRYGWGGLKAGHFSFEESYCATKYRFDNAYLSVFRFNDHLRWAPPTTLTPSRLTPAQTAGFYLIRTADLGFPRVRWIGAIYMLGDQINAFVGGRELEVLADILRDFL